VSESPVVGGIVGYVGGGGGGCALGLLGRGYNIKGGKRTTTTKKTGTRKSLQKY
jgi:hypothetical protein